MLCNVRIFFLQIQWQQHTFTFDSLNHFFANPDDIQRVHVSRLIHFYSDFDDEQQVQQDENMFEIEKIVDERMQNGQKEFIVIGVLIGLPDLVVDPFCIKGDFSFCCSGC